MWLEAEQSYVGLSCVVDQMESIWGFTAADISMRLPSVQEVQCECDILDGRTESLSCWGFIYMKA